LKKKEQLRDLSLSFRFDCKNKAIYIINQISLRFFQIFPHNSDKKIMIAFSFSFPQAMPVMLILVWFGHYICPVKLKPI